MTSSPVPGVTLKTTTANNIHMRYAEAGTGPLVLFCHGWPESWYSWRHQLQAVSAAGFRAVAPDMRGYGGTQSPEPIDQYTLFHLVGDMAELVKALGETQAVIVGHDWGAPVAWHAALWRPDLFTAVSAMSVPYAPPGYVDILSALEKLGIDNFYLQYFQKPGVAEAELQQDIRGALRRLYYTASGEMLEKDKGFGRLTGGTLLANTVAPETLPAWLSEADLDYYAGEFDRAGFRGGLNWYRNLRRNWELSGPWRGQPIRQPSQFIAGSRDGVLRFPAAKSQLDAYPKTLPGLRGSHILDGAGHWVQQERASEVNRLLIEFLKSL
ncbi:MAG: alpha/beta hydrolase [Reyranella sp.]|uniref:alpha/beta fold hydrolase n=1 Tax=Reyranella sp. TaxID=1929291 RepID=UPI0011F89AAB|nr:alpha/beta hydrolase [Reyranella sp.]TAJ84380.1 MAG: alpha/beta hydrolase [Reyranella sp.]TBR29308.1 MAG: alpha/beta hydrolase [Reyranella sp.]